MAAKKEPGRPRKTAMVCPGRSVYTTKGVAFSPALVRPEDLPGGQNEFAKLLKAGFIKYPEPVKKAAADGTQLSSDYFNDDDPDKDPDKEPDKEPDKDPDKEPDKEPDKDPDNSSASQAKAGAKRKKK